MKHLSQRGFTLIEIMVVISIIAFLSSVVFANLAVARVKAQDTARTQTARQVDLAIKSYILDKKMAPANYTTSSDVWVFAYSNDPALSDGSGLNAFQKSMKVLVDAKYLADIPKQIGDIPFFYYNTGDPAIGAIFGATLGASQASTIAAANSCRPRSEPVSSWCSTVNMSDYTGCTLQTVNGRANTRVCSPSSIQYQLPYCQNFVDQMIISGIGDVMSSYGISNDQQYLANTQTRVYFYTNGISFSEMQYLVNINSMPAQHCSSTSASTDVCYCSPI